ncbi:MAG: PEP-CTERM sorting domain-containing protein [Phycisphaerales bacterium]|nr:PEP-CTERM sorting domain-containing protein [Phycisphaerales bacterium]
MKTLLTVAVAMLILTGPAAGDPIPGQADDFQDGTTQNWTTGFSNPTPPVNVADGGPQGAGDAFLRVVSSGIGSSGSRPVIFNFTQWTGDYLTAGVDEIRMDLNNSGPNPLVLRLLLDGAGGQFHTDGVALAVASGWQSATFSVAPGSLISDGGVDSSATMAGVTQLWIYHDPTAGLFPGPKIAAEYGVDNITAFPEPITQGDTNGDHIVNDSDLGNLIAQFGGSPGVQSADFNNSGRVDLEDFVTMRGNFGFGAAPPPPDAIEAIATPEPTTMALLSIGGLFAVFHRKRRLREF